LVVGEDLEIEKVVPGPVVEDVQKDMKDYTKMTVAERFHPGQPGAGHSGESLSEVVKDASKLAATLFMGVPPVLDITEEAMTLTKEEVKKVESKNQTKKI